MNKPLPTPTGQKTDTHVKVKEDGKITPPKYDFDCMYIQSQYLARTFNKEVKFTVPDTKEKRYKRKQLCCMQKHTHTHTP